jgi:Rrf2 family protein
VKLTGASSYGLSILAHLGSQKADRALTSRQIAEGLGIPERFVLKVLKPLVSKGLLRQVRGPGGGYRLARTLREISVLDIVEAVDGPLRLEAVGSGSAGTRVDRRLRTIYGRALDAFREELRIVAVSALLEGDPDVRKFPRPRPRPPRPVRRPIPGDRPRPKEEEEEEKRELREEREPPSAMEAST